MPTVNMQVLEESRRHQVAQKYEVYPLNTSDVENYQIKTTGIESSIKEDARIVQNDLLSQWVESKGIVWSKLDNLKAKTPQILIGLSGNPSAEDSDDGTATFNLFDDFKGITTNVKYLTGWSKSGSNPLQDKTCQNWLIAVYSNYNNEDKIYIFEQRTAAPSNDISCSSFTRANAATPAQWTDHGVVFTAVGAHEDGHIEPHGIFFETQSMSDAREGVGVGLGTPKWRMYYCAKGAGEDTSKYSANFIYASESDLTSWTAYASNPVYNHDGTWGFADSKVCIYNDQVWLHHCKYKPGTVCDPQFFTVSDNGIDNWIDKTTSWKSENTPIGTLISFSTGILLTGRNSLYTEYNGYFTTTGDDKVSYSGNPILSAGGAGVWDEKMYWVSIVVDKNGNANLNNAGTYYLYYIGVLGGVYKLGLATTTTLTEESETTIDSDKWTSLGETISNELVNINAANEYIRSIDTFQYEYAVKSKIKINTYADYSAFGFKTGIDTNSADQAGLWIYDTPKINIVADNPVAGLEYVVNLGDMGTGWRTYELIRHSAASKLEYLVDDGDTSSGNTTDANAIPTGTLPIQLHAHTGNPSVDLDWIFVRKYITNAPIIQNISELNRASLIKALGSRL